MSRRAARFRFENKYSSTTICPQLGCRSVVAQLVRPHARCMTGANNAGRHSKTCSAGGAHVVLITDRGSGSRDMLREFYERGGLCRRLRVLGRQHAVLRSGLARRRNKAVPLGAGYGQLRAGVGFGQREPHLRGDGSAPTPTF